MLRESVEGDGSTEKAGARAEDEGNQEEKPNSFPPDGPPHDTAHVDNSCLYVLFSMNSEERGYVVKGKRTVAVRVSVAEVNQETGRI